MKKDTLPPEESQFIDTYNKNPEIEPDGDSLPDSFFSPGNIDQVVQSYKLIFKHHPTPMWIYDLDSLKFMVVNRAAIAHYGYSEEEFLSMTIRDIRPADELDRLEENLSHGRPTREQDSGVWLHRRKDGSLINVHIMSQTIEKVGSRAVMVVARDITEQLQTNLRLRQLNRIHTILSDVNQAIVRQRNMAELFDQTCKLLVEKGGFDLSWLSLRDQEEGGGLRISACAAESAALLKKAKVRPGIPAIRLGPFFSDLAITSPLFINDLRAGCDEGILPGTICTSDIHSCAILPLMVAGELRGTLNLFSRSAGVIDDQEKDLLLELCEDLSFAIEHADQERKRREAEQELERKTAELDRYFESSLDMLCIADTGGHFRRLNPEWERTLGYPLAELEGKIFLDFVHPDDLPSTLETIQVLSTQQAVKNFTNRYRCKDGSYRWIEWRSFPNGELIYAVARDITAHQAAEENLRQSREQIAAFIEHFPGLAFIKDHSRRMLYASSKHEEYFYIPISQCIGHTMEELIPGPVSDQMREQEEILLRSGRPVGFEVAITRPRKQWMWTTLFPITEKSGEIGIGGFSIDVTDLKKRDHEIQTLYDLSTSLRSVQTREEIIDIITRMTRISLDADSGQVILPDGERRNFYIAGVDGHVSTRLGHTFPIGEGMSSWVWQTGQTYISEDYASDEHHSHNLDRKDLTGPSIFTPLRSEEGLIGVLFVSRLRSPEVQPFTPEEVRLFTAIGELGGSALRRVNLYTDALRRLKHVQALRNIDLAITGDMDLNLTLELMLKEVKNELEVDAVGVLLLDEESESLKFASAQGFNTALYEQSKLRLGEGLGGEIALERVMKSSHNLSGESGFLRNELRRAEGFEVYYGAPMISKGRLLGILEVFHRSAHPTMEEWEDLFVSMAGRGAIAVDNARLISDLQQSNQVLRQAYDATILGWSRAMDLRDEDTEGHTQRVTGMTLNLSRAMGISDEELIHVRRGALLHDMGKLGVPDHILRKPGPLTDEEWSIMRAHPLYTYDMLSPIEFLRPALDIPFFHHERWDGSGYPSGLKGKNIPLAARIFAVVDVYDALTSDRPYRAAWPREKALQHIREGSGSHFDPEVVDLFMSMMDKPSIDPFSLF